MMISLLLLFRELLWFFLPKSSNGRKAFLSTYLYPTWIEVIKGFLARKGTISLCVTMIGVQIFFFFEVRSFLLESIQFIEAVWPLQTTFYSEYLHKH